MKMNVKSNLKKISFFQDETGEGHHLWQEVKKTIRPLQTFKKPNHSKRSMNLTDQIQNNILTSSPTSENNLIHHPTNKMKKAVISHFKIGEKSDHSPVNQLSISKFKDLHHGANLDKKRLKQIQKGKTKIEAKLDLHGLDQNNAKAQLVQFILQQYQNQVRTLLIITGKGSGILQRNVPIWLNQAPIKELMIGFDYANPKHGGEGAIYIHLRRLDKHKIIK